MGAKNPKRFVRTLQQLAQMFTGKQVLNEINNQLDEFIRSNNICLAEFQVRAGNLDTAELKSHTSLSMYRYMRLLKDYNELNDKLNIVRNQIKTQCLPEALQMMSLDLWPLVLKITCRHAEETGQPGSSIEALTSLYAMVERYAEISTTSRLAAEPSNSTEQVQKDSVTIIVVKDPKEER